jgi:peroxiredoxin Q/BCP
VLAFAGPAAAKVVVLAFYPKDRTSGCTAELEKFRDAYTALFGPKAGTDVIVVPTSADALASHAAWAGEARFPFALASDSGLVVAERYGSRRPATSTPNRTLFVIDRVGRVAYRDLRFNALSEDAYRQLAVAERYGSRAPDGRRLSASGARRRHGAGGPTCAAAHSMVRRSA